MKGSSLVKRKRHIKGGASIESIATLLLLILAGVCIFSLAVSSTSASARLYDSKDAASEARVALSFINMKVRQNDLSGGVEVKANPINGSNALVIHESYNDQDYATWIYYDGGKLYEALVLEGETPSLDVSLEVTKLAGFTVQMEKNQTIHTQVTAVKGEKSYTYESLIALRSDLGNGD